MMLTKRLKIQTTENLRMPQQPAFKVAICLACIYFNYKPTFVMPAIYIVFIAIRDCRLSCCSR